MNRTKRKGLTLIEVIVAISIAAILTVGIERLLSTALSAWRLALEEANVSRLSEETSQRMLEGDFDSPGIRDAVELVDAHEDSITFVPLWLDIFERLPSGGKFYLTRRLRAGAPPPLAEIKFPKSNEFKTYFAAIKQDEERHQWVEFGFPIAEGSVVRLTYQPDVKMCPELMMKLVWDSKAGRVIRFYNKSTTYFNLRRETIKTTSLKFTYFDGSNRTVDISGKTISKENALVRINAVKIDLQFQGSELTKAASVLTNIRGLGKSGQGIILAQGLEIPIPDSENIKLMELVNFAGVHEGQFIELKISSPKAKYVWRLKLSLGEEPGEIPVLKHYEIYYPTDKLVTEGDSGESLKQGLDLSKLDESGIYDYDEDEGVTDKVLFKGDQITLTVIRTDPDGVMLVVRP